MRSPRLQTTLSRTKWACCPAPPRRKLPCPDPGCPRGEEASYLVGQGHPSPAHPQHSLNRFRQWLWCLTLKAVADPPRMEPGQEGCCVGPQATQPSSKQHSSAWAAPSWTSGRHPSISTLAGNLHTAFPWQWPTPCHMTPVPPGRPSRPSGLGHIGIPRRSVALLPSL